jgi:hypothetical protein
MEETRQMPASPTISNVGVEVAVGAKGSAKLATRRRGRNRRRCFGCCGGDPSLF